RFRSPVSRERARAVSSHPAPAAALEGDAGTDRIREFECRPLGAPRRGPVLRHAARGARDDGRAARGGQPVPDPRALGFPGANRHAETGAPARARWTRVSTGAADAARRRILVHAERVALAADRGSNRNQHGTAAEVLLNGTCMMRPRHSLGALLRSAMLCATLLTSRESFAVPPGFTNEVVVPGITAATTI